MGFFSKCCAKTNIPVLASTSWPAEYSDVVALMPNGTRVFGCYDGYGNVDGYSFSDEWDKVKFVLKRFYHNELYADLPVSRDDPGQGHFHSAGFIMNAYEKGGFASQEEFRKELGQWEDHPVREAGITLTMPDTRTSASVQLFEYPHLVYHDGSWGAAWDQGPNPNELVEPARLLGISTHLMSRVLERIADVMTDSDVCSGTVDPDEDGVPITWAANIPEPRKVSGAKKP